MTRLSYVHGASETALIGATIGVYFDKAVAHFGERDAVIVRRSKLTPEQRQEAIKRHDEGLEMRAEIARRYTVHPSTISGPTA